MLNEESEASRKSKPTTKTGSRRGTFKGLGPRQWKDTEAEETMENLLLQLGLRELPLRTDRSQKVMGPFNLLFVGKMTSQ